jgi:integrase
MVAAPKAHKATRGTLVLSLARDDAYVLANLDGTIAHPERFSRKFVTRVAAARRVLGDDALPTIRLHDLRHTHASILLASGVPVKVVSERLGHASPIITLGVYAHVMPGMQAEAAAKFGALVYGGSS